MEQTPHLKSLVDDIINKFLHYINPDVLKEAIYKMIERFYSKGLEQGEIQFNMNFLPDYETLAFIQKFSFDNVKGLTEELKERLRKEISIGLMNQESPAQLKLRIIDVMDTTIARSEMIYRTEMSRAFNVGHYEAAKNSGLDLVKQWNSQPERVSKAGNLVPCPRCEAMNGKQVEIDKPFIFEDGEQVLLPPLHPHCSCVCIFLQKHNATVNN